jgi:hypothetical protein
MKRERSGVDDKFLFLFEQDVEPGVAAGVAETRNQVGLDFLDFLQIEADIARDCHGNDSTHRFLLILPMRLASSLPASNNVEPTVLRWRVNGLTAIDIYEIAIDVV